MRTLVNALTASALLATTALILPAQAQPTIDGSIDGDSGFYGAALSSQPTQTHFGDNSSDDLVLTASGGSEINEVFSAIANDRLYVMITGNLETNFNKLEVFFDSVAGGVNTLDGASLPQGVDGFCCGLTDPNDAPTLGDGALQKMDGLTFDTGFEADRYLTFSNGTESVNNRGGGDPDEDPQSFWAVSAHFADLTGDAPELTSPLGYQLAPQGLPQVLRNPMDYNRDGVVNTPDYTVWRDSLGMTGEGLAADGNGDGTVDITDYNNWQANFGADASLSGPEFLPSADFASAAQVAAGVVLPGLNAGELIDRDYALGAGGCTNDDGDNCVAEELEFALDVASDETNNGSDHRNFNNTVDLELAFDNSNIAGVDGGTGDTTVDASTATTGIEFSIPLSALGDPTGDIKLLAFINGGSHDFVSNQFSGAGLIGDPDTNPLDPSRENPGNAFFNDGPDPPLFTLADHPGDQFVTITQPAPISATPEPSSMLLVFVNGLAMGVRRRR